VWQGGGDTPLALRHQSTHTFTSGRRSPLLTKEGPGEVLSNTATATGKPSQAAGVAETTLHPDRKRPKLLLISMFVLLLTVGIIVVAAIRIANTTSLRADRIILWGPGFQGRIPLRAAAIDANPSGIAYYDQADPASPYVLLKQAPFRISQRTDFITCRVWHWRGWFLIQDFGERRP
jgi:hypothetical protein